jgi:6-pyruvoyltetrahydropterin/6-carboxytetrahydropterin synthase
MKNTSIQNCKHADGRRRRRAHTPTIESINGKVEGGEVLVTRVFEFNGAHQLYNHARCRRWNTRKFGLCSNPQWHGHNYVLEVTFKGLPDVDTGYVVDLKVVKDAIADKIISVCDHQNLNTQVPFLRAVNPTLENLVRAFWEEIGSIQQLEGLYHIRLYETPRNFADYYGPARIQRNR